jgi:hypothetical protein
LRSPSERNIRESGGCGRGGTKSVIPPVTAVVGSSSMVVERIVEGMTGRTLAS